MKILLPFKTPTVNHLYFVWRNRKILTKEARNLKKEVKEWVLKAHPDKNLKGNKLYVEIEVFENWYTKKNEVKKKDLANREKFIIDAVFDTLEIDDKMVFELVMRKKQLKEGENEHAIVRILALNPEVEKNQFK